MTNNNIPRSVSKERNREVLKNILGVTLDERRYSEVTPDQLEQMILLLCGKPLPQQPRRDDEVAKWLKARRDELPRDHWGNHWSLIDGLLDDYRLHADTSTPLDQHVCTTTPCEDCDA